MITNIYVESNTEYPRKKERMIAFIVDYTTDEGKQALDPFMEPVVCQGFYRKNATYAEGILTALTFALAEVYKLGMLTDDVHIRSRNGFVTGALNNCLEAWRENDYARKDGSELQNRRYWKNVGEMLRDKQVQAACGTHAYCNWLINEMNRREEACLSRQAN